MLIEPANLKVSIVGWVADEPQPGLVEAHFADSPGQIHVVVDKPPIFTIKDLGPAAAYPVEGMIRGVIVEILDDATVIIDTSAPDGIATTDGTSQFAVSRQQLEIDITAPRSLRAMSNSEFWERDYREVRDWLATVFTDDRGRYLLDILDSIIGHGADRYIALTTSMHDLLFALRPAIPPVDIIAVRAPGSMRPPSDRHIRIEHVDHLRHITVVERHETEALAVFWRFMRTEFGIAPEYNLD
jgi:hypothetical protein